jgi:hypothetical protein
MDGRCRMRYFSSRIFNPFRYFLFIVIIVVFSTSTIQDGNDEALPIDKFGGTWDEAIVYSI